MSEYQYPQNDLDNPKALLSLLGSFWTDSYQGYDLVSSIAAARLAAERQAHKDFNALVNSADRLACEVLHHEDWYPLTLRESAKNPADFTVARYADASLFFEEVGSLQYGLARGTPLHVWLLPPGLVDAPLIVNRVADASLTWIRGIDFTIVGPYIIFRTDPFNNALVPARPLLQDNQTVDREAGLWISGGKFDRQTLYRQFGYALRLKLTSSPHYKALLNAILDTLVEGSTSQRIRQAWSAVTGIPLIRNTQETVLQVVAEADRRLVITDLEAYELPLATTVTVTPGQVLQQHATLCDAVTFFEFNRGQCPSYADVKALALGRGFLAAGFFGDLVFENTTVPLGVTTDAEGNTRISFEVDGWPGDVEKFFDDLHTRGLAAGKTLAHLLDRRPAENRDTEPLAGALPPTINPLRFLCQNVLRTNAFMVKLKTRACQGGTGMNAAKALRAVLPPETVMIVVTDLAYADAAITMDGPGDTVRAGYTEAASVFLGLSYDETVTPDNISERVRLRQIAGRCM